MVGGVDYSREVRMVREERLFKGGDYFKYFYERGQRIENGCYSRNGMTIK